MNDNQTLTKPRCPECGGKLKVIGGYSLDWRRYYRRMICAECHRPTGSIEELADTEKDLSPQMRVIHGIDDPKLKS